MGWCLPRRRQRAVLGPWRGPAATEHVRIPVGQGVCGAAAASGKTEILDDVNEGHSLLRLLPLDQGLTHPPTVTRCARTAVVAAATTLGAGAARAGAVDPIRQVQLAALT